MAAEPRDPRPPCPRCGVVDCAKHCGADRSPDPPCTLPKGWGTDHVGIGRCRKHFGNTPNHQIHADRERAQRAVADFAARRDVEPTEALLEVLGIRAGMVAYLRAVIADMDDERSLTQSVGEEARPSVWVELLETALREYARVAKACADAKIDERRIRIEESIGRQLSDVIRRVLDGVFAGLGEAGLDGAALATFQRDQVPGIVRRALAALVLRGPTTPAAKA